MPSSFRIGHVSHPIRCFNNFAECCAFVKQSLSAIICDPLLPALHFCNTNNIRHPFSRSYGVILPSSLTRVRSNTLGYSPRPPVSVCGTVCILICLEAISRRRIYMDFADCSSSCTSEYAWHGFACATSYMHSTAIPTAVSTAPSRHSIAQHTGPGILTWLPSASPYGYTLGAD